MVTQNILVSLEAILYFGSLLYQNMLMRSFFLFILLAGCVLTMKAQDFSNKGKDFWIAYGNHVRMFNSGAPETMQLYITSDVQTSGTISIPGIGVSLPFSVLANQITTVDIPRAAALLDEGSYNYGIHVTAEKPVVVYSFIYVNAISGATLCLPTNTLGREYYSVNYTQVSNEQNSYSYFSIVATDTGATTVQITPAARTKGGRPAGVPFLVTLSLGQVYQVLSATDLTGSSIKSISNGSSCKRIAVFCGSGKISIGCGNSSTSDNLYQQMYPVNTWGKTYVTTPTINEPRLVSQNNYFRIFKSDPAAVVKVNGQVLPASWFTRNQYADLPPNNVPNFIESDKPILVAQYLTTQGCGGNSGDGDPEMIYLNPLEQTISHVTLNSMEPSSSTNINQHYINVVIRNKPELISSFKIDGLVSGAFTPLIYNADYAYAQIAVSKGTHTLTADSGFNAISYGFGNAESYGYSAGTNLKDLYQFVSIRNQYATVDIPAGCRASPFRFSMSFPYQPVKLKWVFNGILPDTTVNSPVYDSSWLVNGKTIYRYTLDRYYVIPKIGVYPIKVVADNPVPDGCSGEQEVSYDLQIFERPAAAFNVLNSGCLSDSVILTDVTDGGGRAIIRWNWDIGLPSKSEARVARKYTQPGTYSIKFSAITDVGCVSDTIEKKLVLTEEPVALFETSSPACEGAMVSFTDKSLPAGKIKSWNWKFGDGSASSETSPKHIFSAANNYAVSLVIESVTGCKSDPQQLDLPVHYMPKPDFLLPEICLDDPYASFLDATSIGDQPNSVLRYAWSFGDKHATTNNPDESAEKDPRHRFIEANDYNIHLAVTSAQGCVADTTKKFTVNGAVPKAGFAILNTGALCSNKEIRISNQSTVDFGNITRVEIYWDYANDPANKTADEDPVPGKVYLHKYPEFGTPASKDFQVVYVAYSGINCMNESRQTITIAGVPKISFTALDPVCEERAPFMILNASDIYQYPGIGMYSGAGVSANGLFTPSISRDGIHTIRYTYTAANGCSSFAEQDITVLPTPFVNAGPDMYLFEGESITLKASATPGSKYLWLPETAIQANNVLSPVVSPIDDIVYRLQVTAVNGCVGTDEVKLTVLKKILVPNIFSPNGDGINDTWRIEHLDKYPGSTIEIFNRYGQQVFYSNGYNRLWDGNFKGKPLPTGTYYWVIDPKNGKNKMKGSITIIR